MPYRVRCRYCRCVLLSSAGQLGGREARTVRHHLEGCYPNIGRLPHTIGELLAHLSVDVTERVLAVAEPRPILPPARRELLLVDHDERSRASLRSRLSADGFAVATAGDAVEALRRLYAGLQPCAIVVDEQLPRVGGFELASWLAHHPTYGAIPIVALTGAAPHVATSAVARTFAAPLDYPALAATIERLCAPSAVSGR